jgi:hypothetical protein
MKTKISIAALALLALLNACMTEIDFKQEDIAPKIVVNAINTIDSVFMVDVTASKPIPGVESYIKSITDAKVVLLADGKEIDQLAFTVIPFEMTDNWINHKSNYYRSKIKPEPGKTYSIEVSHPDYQTVTSQTTVPSRIVISKFDTVKVTLKEQDYEYNKIKVTLTFSDPSNEKNFYRLFISSQTGRRYNQYYHNYLTGKDSTASVVQVNSNTTSRIDSDDPVLNQQQDANDILFGSMNENPYTIFTDDLFNGKTYELSFYISPYLFNEIERVDTSKQEFARINIEFQSLSEDTYWYIKSLGASNEILDGIMTEPVQMYSNIDKGLGIFGVYSPSVFGFNKGAYPIDTVKYTYSYSYSSYR